MEVSNDCSDSKWALVSSPGFISLFFAAESLSIDSWILENGRSDYEFEAHSSMICTHSIGLFKEKETKSDLISKSSSKDSYAVKYVVQAAQINA